MPTTMMSLKHPRTAETPPPADRVVGAARRALFVLAIVVVAAVSAAFAAYFREVVGWLLERIGDSHNPTLAAAFHPRWVTALIVFSAVVLAAEMAYAVRCKQGQQAGIGAVANAARGEGDGPAMRCTMWRTSATFIGMTGMASMGREAALLETGGALGASVGRKFKLPIAPLAIVGVSSAFAAAYHAPIAGVFYLREHIVPGADRRATTYAAIGGAAGYGVSYLALDHRHLLAKAHDPYSLPVLALVILGVVPAMIATRAFFAGRKAASHPRPFISRHRRAFSIGFAVVAAAMVALFPLVSGNGMDLIRHSTVEATVSVALVMLVAKTIATVTALAAGAPGGVMFPSMAVAGGAALLLFHAPGISDIGDPGARWDAMLVIMVIAVSIGARAPWAAVFMIPELTGDWRLLPLTVFAVLAASAAQDGLDELRHLGLAARRRRLLVAEFDA